MGKKSSKKKKREPVILSPKAMKAYRRVEPVMLPLIELFSVVDDVMDEPDAFAPESIHKSLGRIYRSWMDTREALDPDFDRKRYRHEMKSRSSKSSASTSGKRKTPLGREQLASVRLTSSTDSKSTSEKSRKKSARPESKPAKTSARDARSDSHASGGRSRTRKSGASGEASRSGSGIASRSGSTKSNTPRSRKATD